VTLVGGDEALVRLTVTLIDPDDLLDNTNASLPLTGIAAVDSRLVLVDVDVSRVEPGRMNRLK
jgi:hypothetical protein